MQSYETDVIAWANEQAAFIRAARFDQLDLEHIADEIEDVGKSEQREFMSHMTGLIAHLLKWQFQPTHRGASWEKTIKAKRIEIGYNLMETPSLKSRLTDPSWFDVVWAKALAQAVAETGMDVFPDVCPWDIAQIMDPDFWPG